MPKLTSILFAIGVIGIACTTIVLAQGGARAEPALVINGTPIENSVRTIGSKTYIDLEAITKALNLELKRSSAVISISSSSSISTSPGWATSVSGNLSYYFNRNYGSKPDVGSKVYLLEAITEPFFTETDSVIFAGDELIVAKAKDDMKKYKVLHATAADGNGRFEFRAIEPKKYVLIAVSAHSRGKTQSDILGKKLTKSIEVKPGFPIDVSHDFGMTYY